jgi:hypothetical protein
MPRSQMTAAPGTKQTFQPMWFYVCFVPIADVALGLCQSHIKSVGDDRMER